MNLTVRSGGRGFSAPPLSEQTSLGTYATYEEAQRVVDYLADHEFQVATTQIIGTDLRMVEQITGRLTWPRALLSGAASGAWFGIFVGLLINILGATSFLRALTFGLTWGLLFGVGFAAVGYAMTAGRRDFTSLSATVPSKFEVLVLSDHAEQARSVLAGLSR
ncbi:MAG: general stress protein [Streptosporangiaceae bacterium]